MTRRKTKDSGGEKAGEVLRATIAGSVACGEKHTSVGVRFARGALTLTQADELFVGSRLRVELQGIGPEEQAGQELLWDDAKADQPELEAEADCTGFRVGKPALSLRLTFGAGDAGTRNALLALRGADVRARFERLGEAGSGEDGGAE